MQDEKSRGYRFVAFDRATRWVFLEIRKDKSVKSAKGFLSNLLKKAFFKITRILMDCGKEFTDRFSTAVERQPTGQHLLDQVCSANQSDHRLIKLKHPQTNGVVKRFNGGIADIHKATRYDSSVDLKQTLGSYQGVYNHHIPQRALGRITPVKVLAMSKERHPDLFVKRLYEQARLDR